MIIFIIISSMTFSMYTQRETTRAEAKPNNTRSLEVTVVWSDNVESHLTENTTVTLYQNGISKSTVTLNSPNWYYKWTGLDTSSTYNVYQNASLPGYHTEYTWGSKDWAIIRNIKNEIPSPPTPTPTPSPTPKPEPGYIPGTNVFTELYESTVAPTENSQDANQNTDQNSKDQSSNNNNATIHNNSNSANSPMNKSNDYTDNFMQNLHKSWLIILVVASIFTVFTFEKISVRKRNGNEKKH